MLWFLNHASACCRPTPSSLNRTKQVSVVVQSDAPEATGRRLLSAWNDPASRLHVGAVAGLIDFSQV